MKKISLNTMITLTLIGGAFFASAPVQKIYAQNPLTIYYFDRAPYYYKSDNGKVHGIIVDPVVQALNKAGVNYIFEELPAKRHLKYLRQNHPNICCIGWYKNPEREEFAKFSIPIFQDKSRIAVTSRENTLLTSGKSLEEVFKTPAITLIVKDGFSYGKYIDQKIKEFQPAVYMTTRSSAHMIERIAKRKTSYFFISEVEADVLIPKSGHQLSEFKYIYFTDIPVGLKRYLMCSQATDDDLITDINKAILDTISLNPEQSGPSQLTP